jgi:hypothetical protein
MDVSNGGFMRILMLPIFVVSVAMSGCANNPYADVPQPTKAIYGAGIGAAVGCGVAAATTGREHRSSRCLQGAGVGGAVGAATGVYMDHQQNKANPMGQ